MDTSFHAAVLGGSDATVTDFFPADGVDAGPYHGDFSLGQNPAGAPALADPMDLDFDFDAALWAGDFGPAGPQAGNHPLDHSMAVDYAQPAQQMPADFLFAEDEGVLPATTAVPTTQPTTTQALSMLPPMHPAEPSPTNTVFAVARSESGSDDAKSLFDGNQNDLARARLRRQLSLLAKGWAGDEIRFKNCDQSKAVVLHSLAMELGLGYNHDVRSSEVSLSRPETAPIAKSQTPPGRLTSAQSRSSTELDTALCLPGLPSVPEYEPFQFADHRGRDPGSQTSSAASLPIHSVAAVKEQPLGRRLSRGERIHDSISKHVTTLKTSISKGGRRGPLTENGRRDMRALEAAGGACWRCKVLRRKCDPGSPCRCCLQIVPIPHPGEDAPLWPLIGCRRGPLRDAILPQLLCPADQRLSSAHRAIASSSSTAGRRGRSVGVAERWLLSAESQRLADMKAVLEGDELSITDPALRASFKSFVEAGRYRDSTSLQRGHTIGGSTYTYADLIASIAWELAENHSLLGALEIRSWETFMNMLETAGIYEAEVGQTSLVIVSMICLRHCLEALRLHSANLLTADAHEDCGGGFCQVECIRNLTAQLATYVDELSAVMFNKENMRDRRWWLSTFYSLYMQSYVRHALIIIEKQLRFHSSDDVSSDEPTATQYMHLPAVLFTAASTKYDPLFDGRLQYALTDNSVIPETSVPELHHSSARIACEVDKWPEAGIRTPYQFLRSLLQIGSLDFFESAGDASRANGSKSPMTALTSPSSTWNKVASPISPSVGFDDTLASPRPPFGRPQSNRDSWGSSKYSAQTPTRFSNLSSDSLARTMSTDMTSLYESSIFATTTAAISYQGSVADLRMETGTGTVNPTALFSSAGRNASSQSLDRVLAESCARNDALGLGLGVVQQQQQPPPAFMCSCCPRAPRHFHTSEELAQHESEKPHPCTRCKKRFKSPTEAERHLNAIHLKSDFWSCKALENPLHAYHTTSRKSHQPADTNDSSGRTSMVLDVCGFCGGEFPRRVAEGGETYQNTKELIAHVESVHRIRECDGNKKFYRADNFRQHLKNTHVALPGRWLKVLERGCRSGKSEEGVDREGVQGLPAIGVAAAQAQAQGAPASRCSGRWLGQW
ncbi:hypothetical protein VTJ83DRAFT_6026 [Remersonia thermophila]|uniref:C2H2-type domain-containing protein n=1 Tax=Remersonia thermophila TaxID=72144 RepID=A0ABR4D9H1_9PEZI